MSELTKEQKLDAANEARAEVKQCLSLAKDGSQAELSQFVEDYVAKHSLESRPITVADVLTSMKDGNGRTALHFAASAGQDGVVGWILHTNPKMVDTQDDKGLTPLALALITGHVDTAQSLLAAGADVNKSDHDGVCCIHRAAGHGDIAAVELLRKHGADLERQSGAGTPLHWAAGEGRDEVIARLLQLGAQPDSRNSQGLTPLIMAAAHGPRASAAAAKLVRAGAEAGLILSGGLTVLHMCADLGSEEAVSAILETESGRKSAVLGDLGGSKAVHYAAMGGHRAVVEMLVPHSGELGGKGVEELLEEGPRLLEEYNNRQQAEGAGAPPEAGGDTTPPEPCTPAASPELAAQALACKDRGNACLQRKDWEGAVGAYSEGIRLDGACAALWSNRSAARLLQGNPQAALVDALVCVRLKPEWAKAHYRVAVASLALQKHEQAANAAWEGLRLDPSNDELKSLLQKCVRRGKQAHMAGREKASQSSGGKGDSGQL